MPYKQSKTYTRQPSNPPQTNNKIIKISELTVQDTLLEHILSTVQKNHLEATITQIDTFATKNWMMNIGPEKIEIIQHYVKGKDIRNVLEIGGYCGYSALQFCRIMPKATIHTIEINQKYANIAKNIQNHTGVSQRIHIHIGTIQTLQHLITATGPYDIIFLDHEKTIYLQDYLLLQKYGVIKKDTIIIADNIVYPGAPTYLAHFINNQEYDSVLEHTNTQYCDIPDAILISTKLTNNNSQNK